MTASHPSITFKNNLELKIEENVIEMLAREILPEANTFLNYSTEQLVFIDNINGGFDVCQMPMHRETGVGFRFNTWCRARAIIHALLKSLELHPILSTLPNECKHIKGLGISDDFRYARHLEQVFEFVNTYFHQEPRLDLMCYNDKYKSAFDFVICSDVLEHTIGPWQEAILNIYRYLKPGGVLILTVPLNKDLVVTREHYPGATGYEVVFVDGNYQSTKIQYSDRCELALDPVFHRGPGNTLEMRVFALADLQSNLIQNGFTRYDFYELCQPLFGIVPSDPYEGVLCVFK